MLIENKENMNVSLNSRKVKRRSNVLDPENNNSQEEISSSPKRSRLEPDKQPDLKVAGKIAEVHLQNFMCHANLSVKFNNNGNNCFYFSGSNGSGKSAIFAGINIGLGGKGSSNDRGNSVKSYIKEGASNAKISITLTNEGVNNMPEYGKYIIIERTIGQTSSTYTLKSDLSNNKKIGSKKSDVDRVVQRFNIHVENPALWMTQDRSRNFLNNFNPSGMYDLYLKATELENIKNSYTMFADTIREIRIIYNTKMKEIETRERTLARYQAMRDSHKKLDVLNKKKGEIEWCLLFATVRDVEGDIALISEKLDANREAKCDNEKRREKNLTMKSNAMSQIEKIEESLNDLNVESFQSKRLEAKNAKMSVLADINEAKSSISAKKKDIQLIDKKIGDAQEKIKTIQSKLTEDSNKRKFQFYQDKYKEYKSQREAIDESGEIDKLKEMIREYEENNKTSDRRMYEVRRNIQEKASTVSKGMEQLKRANAVKVNKINKYGHRMSELIAAIEKNKDKFSKVPKGPLGKYITLVNPKWQYPIEECIGNLCNQFICNSTQDAELMRNIFNKLQLQAKDRPSLIVSRFLGKCHSNLMEPDEKFETIYRTIRISDPDVHNAVIDKSGIESILLLEKNHDAMTFMDSNSPPRNASKAYTLDGSQAYVGGPFGQYRFYAGRGKSPRGLFVEKDENIDERAVEKTIVECKAELQRLENVELQEVKEECSKNRDIFNKATDRLTKLEQRIDDLRRKEIAAERDLRDIEAVINESNDDDEIYNLNKCIEEFNSMKSVNEQEIRDLKEKLKNLDDKYLEREKDFKKEDKAYVDVVSVYQSRRKEIESLQEEILEIERVHEMILNQANIIDCGNRELQSEDLRLQEEKLRAMEYVEKNKKIFKKPENMSDPPDLSQFPITSVATEQYETINKDIQFLKSKIDENVTMELVHDFKTRLIRDRNLCKKVKIVIDNMTELLQSRVQLYPTLRKFTEMKVQTRFKDLLVIRGHLSGRLVFDNDERKLEIIVTSKVDSSEKDDNVEASSSKSYKKEIRDLKGLSGGERSFVTAALVMSLWEVMDQPFRLMDEFDVFMDMVNRKMVMDLLVEMATTKFPYNQFIFFTPQGIKELKQVDGLEVFELQKGRIVS